MILATAVDTSTRDTTKIVCSLDRPNKNKFNKIGNMKCNFCPEKQKEFCRRIASYTTGKRRMLFPVYQYLYDGVHYPIAGSNTKRNANGR
jgi:hypothetical protein